MSILNLLEQLGKSSECRQLSDENISSLIESLELDENVKKALLNNSKEELSKSMGFKHEIRCYISSPNKDDEIPNDGNRPDEEDLPTDNQQPLPKVG